MRSCHQCIQRQHRYGIWGDVNWGALQAGVIVSIIPSLAIFLALQRYYMDGLMGGAVKN